MFSPFRSSTMSAPPNPPNAAALPDVDSRHVPGPNPPGEDTPKPEEPKVGEGMGPDAWGNKFDTPVSHGKGTPKTFNKDHPHVFPLSYAAANVFDGGSLQGTHSENWPILKHQNAAVYLARLEVGGVREPHWHPSAWEVNFVLSGRVKWSFVGPNGTQDIFEAEKGDVVFAPQGHFHYFENASSTEELLVLIVFNSDAVEPHDDIGLMQSISAVPKDVLAACLGVDIGVLKGLPKVDRRVVITKKQKQD